VPAPSLPCRQIKNGGESYEIEIVRYIFDYVRPSILGFGVACPFAGTDS
jgi:hypothetical protein